MSRFCGNCGTQVNEAARFCANCGAQTGPSQQTAAQALPAANKGLSTAGKFAIASVLIIFLVGGAMVAGVFYAAHRISQKLHEVKAEIINAHDSGPMGDPCRYLNKEDVGAAIGVEIVKTQADADSCSYLAMGNAGDMAAKHASSMLGAKGADAHTQKIFEQFGKTIFDSMPRERQNATSDGAGRVAVLAVSVSDSPSAIAEMKLNAKVLKNLGGPPGEDLDIGDQAFVSGESVMMIRKGSKVIRILYMTCPCGTRQVIPLAKKIAGSL
ncbi:MAG TPA: zinc-ribbon domain-containing protein [Bryobacteraceae bacterium]|jgi:hypothetical protein|nr:zinc-ribbon domain-containing protein [Bryobacteraceae bacterium]